MAFTRAAHVMCQRPTTARALRHDHLATQPAQKPDRRVVDIGVQCLLRAAGHQRDAHPAFPPGGKYLGVVIAADRRDDLWRHRNHRPEPRVRQEPREGPRHLRPQQREAEKRRIRDHPCKHPAQRPITQGPAIGRLDMRAGMVDQVHVVHPRWAGRHAGKAGQAAVDMLDGPGIGRPAVLKHVLDQVDTTPRAVEFVAQHLVGRAGRGAKAAMHAGPQDLVGAGNAGIAKLLFGEIRLHQPIRPGLRMPLGSNRARRPAAIAATGADSGWNGAIRARVSVDARISVACPSSLSGRRSRPGAVSTQTSPPPQS